MANPTAAAIATIDAYVSGLAGGWAAHTDAQVVTAANTPAIANPVPQGTVPKPYTSAQLLGLLSATSLASLETFPAIHDLFADVDAQNSAAVLAAVSLLSSAAKITATEATNITAAVNATEPDPSYQAQIGWATAHLGRDLDLDDVAAARPPA